MGLFIYNLSTKAAAHGTAFIFPLFLYLASQTMESLLLHLMRLDCFPIPTLSLTCLSSSKAGGNGWIDVVTHVARDGRLLVSRKQKGDRR